jgi:hypothetical protein
VNFSDLQLKQFLLGQLSEVEREAIEKPFLTDDKFHQRVEIVESELLEEYLEGSLSPVERKAVEERLSQGQLKTIRSLKALAQETAEARERKFRQCVVALIKVMKDPSYSQLSEATRKAVGSALTQGVLKRRAGKEMK